MRALMTTEISGDRVLEAFATLGASMPVTVIDGLFQMRLRIVPVPMGLTPSGRPASSRRVSSVYSGVSASRSVSPATATAPVSSHSVDRSLSVAIMASGTAPPNMAERVGVVGEELCERARARLLLALDEERDAEVEVLAHGLLECPEGADVRHDAGLVVGRPAAVQPAAPHGRLERRRLPLALVPDG